MKGRQRRLVDQHQPALEVHDDDGVRRATQDDFQFLPFAARFIEQVGIVDGGGGPRGQPDSELDVVGGEGRRSLAGARDHGDDAVLTHDRNGKLRAQVRDGGHVIRIAGHVRHIFGLAGACYPSGDAPRDRPGLLGEFGPGVRIVAVADHELQRSLFGIDEGDCRRVAVGEAQNPVHGQVQHAVDAQGVVEFAVDPAQDFEFAHAARQLLVGHLVQPDVVECDGDVGGQGIEQGALLVGDRAAGGRVVGDQHALELVAAQEGHGAELLQVEGRERPTEAGGQVRRVVGDDHRFAVQPPSEQWVGVRLDQ